MTDFVFGMFAGAFAVPLVVWSAVSWWIILYVLGFVAVFGLTAKEWDKAAGILLFVVAVCIGLVYVPDSVTGWWNTLLAAAMIGSVGLAKYLIIGIPVGILLFVHWQREKLLSLNKDFRDDYLQKVMTQCALIFSAEDMRQGYVDNRNTADNTPRKLTPAELQTCRNYVKGGPVPDFLAKDWAFYRRTVLMVRDNATSLINNKGRLFSYVFLWFFHLFVRLIGDIFDKFLDLLYKLADKVIGSLRLYVRRGIPENLD